MEKTLSDVAGRCLLSKVWHGARRSPHPSQPPPLSSRPPIQHDTLAAALWGNITRVTRRGVLTGCEITARVRGVRIESTRHDAIFVEVVLVGSTTFCYKQRQN